jgi:hypothetical protein
LTFIIPSPDKSNKVYNTSGVFIPAASPLKNNANGLCGTGKLTADVEPQVCTPQGTAAPEPAPTPEAAPAPETGPPTLTPADQAKKAQQYADCLKAAVDNPSIVCK